MEKKTQPNFLDYLQDASNQSEVDQEGDIWYCFYNRYTPIKVTVCNGKNIAAKILTDRG